MYIHRHISIYVCIYVLKEFDIHFVSHRGRKPSLYNTYPATIYTRNNVAPSKLMKPESEKI